jgi:hypothetical protein
MARKEFDLTKCVSKDLTRYFMTGIFHENGCKIATDGRILVSLPAVYPADWEKKIIDMKTFKEVEGQFPNYKRIYDTFDSSANVKKINSNIFKGVTENLKLNDEFIKFADSQRSRNNKTACACLKLADGVKIYLRLAYFRITLEFIASHGDADFEVFARCYDGSFENCNVMIKYSDGDFLILASVAREYPERDCTKRLMIGENVDFVFEPVEAVGNNLNIDGVLFNYLMFKKMLGAYTAFNKGILTKETIESNEKAQKILSSLMFVKDIEK